MMQILTILSSRNREGRTARSAASLAEGAAAAGASVDDIFLTELKIERCRQCDAGGWGTCRSEGKCVIDDDFASVADRMRGADALVFANPVYFGDLSESMRAFLDRLRRCCRHEHGKAGIETKPAVGICMAGGGGGGAPSCCLSMEKVLSQCGMSVVDLIPVRRQNLPVKLELLRHEGQALAQGRLQG